MCLDIRDEEIGLRVDVGREPILLERSGAQRCRSADLYRGVVVHAVIQSGCAAIDGISDSRGLCGTGDADDLSITGIIEGRGSKINISSGSDPVPNTDFAIVTRGEGYAFSNANNIPLRSLTGSGTGALCSVSITNGVVDSNGITITNEGEGYQVGEVLTIDNSDVKVLRGFGFKLVVTKIDDTLDTLFLTDVQGDKFSNTETLIQYGNNNNTRTVVSPATKLVA